MLREMADLGFDQVELSHGVRIVLVPGFLKAVEEGVNKVGSTPNFCPLPIGVVQAAPNLFEPSATDHKEHEQWVRHTKRSIDFAAQVRARVLVCHLGSVSFFWSSPARKLKKYLSGKPNAVCDGDLKYTALVAKALEKTAEADEAVLGANAGKCTRSFRLCCGQGCETGLRESGEI